MNYEAKVADLGGVPEVIVEDIELDTRRSRRRRILIALAIIVALIIGGALLFYGGSEEQARQLFKLGFMIGIGGPVTYDRANRIRRVVKTMPLEFLLLETDSPDQPNTSHRGERNEPARLVEVCECVAALRGVEPDAIAEATTSNARRLFDLG